jgi:hypothetical protein
LAHVWEKRNAYKGGGETLKEKVDLQNIRIEMMIILK